MTKKPSKSERREKALTAIVGHLMNRVLVARYDSLQRHPTRPAVEIRAELSETENQFTADKRILAYALCDNLIDNTTAGSIIDTCIRLTVGRDGGNLIFGGADADTMSVWFRRWSRHCGYAEGETLQEVLGVILHCVKVHGDCLVWCDPVLTGGKLRVFDADQICNVSVPDFDRWKFERGLPESCRQVEGVVVDGTGKVHGYFVTMLRNRYSVNLDDAMFLPVDTCRRVGYKRKHSQYRGEPSLLRSEEITADTKDLMKSEIGAAKLAAEYGFIVKQPAGVDTDDIASLVDGYSSLDELQKDTGVDIGELERMGNGHDAKTFEAFAGKSAIASLPAGADVQNLSNGQRPSPQIQTWLDNLDISNGKALGIMSCLAKGRADNSYSSGEIELQISWKAFEEDQALLEDDVIGYAMGVLWPNAIYDVHWPKSISIDPEKEQKTYTLALGNGLTTFREILGSDWKRDLKQLADEKAYIKGLGLDNLSFFATPSGNESSETMADHPLDENDGGGRERRRRRRPKQGGAE